MYTTISSTPSRMLDTLQEYAAATLGRVKIKKARSYFEYCPWCKASSFSLKTYVKDGKGLCVCMKCRKGGDIMELAGAYLGRSTRQDWRQIKAHIMDRLQRSK